MKARNGRHEGRTDARLRTRPAAAVLSLLLVPGAVLVFIGVVEPDSAIAGLVILLVAVLVHFTERSDLRDLVGRVTKISPGGIEFAERALSDATAAAKETTEQEDTNEAEGETDLSSTDTPDATSARLIDLRLALDRKLTYIAKHLLAENVGGDEYPTYVTVGSLEYDKYITTIQARALIWLLMARPDDLSSSPGVRFFDEAARVVRNLRATVFQHLVGKIAKEAGWKSTRVRDKPGRRVIELDRDGRRLLIIPVWTTGQNHKNVDRARERVQEEHETPAWVVVPNQSTADCHGEPRVLRLDQLASELEAL